NLVSAGLTELGAARPGGIGNGGSGNDRPGRVSMFEPIHGSAPKHAGRNVASPIGSILAAQMPLEQVGEKEGGELIEESVAELFATGQLRSAGTDSGVGTREQGEAVRRSVRRRAATPT